MNLSGIAQNVVFGIFVGSNYGVAAAGLSLVFGVLRVLNVAHGELLMLGGYASFWLFSLAGVDPFVSVLISAPALLLLGIGGCSRWSNAWTKKTASRTLCWSASGWA